MIVVGIIGLFTGVGLVEDAFADHDFDIVKFKEGKHQSTQIFFTHPIELNDGNDGFEFLRNGEITTGFVKKRTNDSVLQFKFHNNIDSVDTLFTVNYDGSSNNLQYDGKPVHSFSISKPANSNDGYMVIEDAFTDQPSLIQEIAKTKFGPKIIFNDPFDLTKGNRPGFEFLKDGQNVEFDITNFRNLGLLITLDEGKIDRNTSYTINYNGSSNNLQQNGEPIPSFSIYKDNDDTRKWIGTTQQLPFFELNNEDFVEETLQEGDIYHFPSWYLENENVFGYTFDIRYYNFTADDWGVEISSLDGESLEVGEYHMSGIFKSDMKRTADRLSHNIIVLEKPELNAPSFKVLKDDRIYSESKFYRFQQSNDIVPGTIIDIQDESHTRQTIETKYINSQLTAITYKVIDTFNNTSSITEAVFIGTGFFDGRFHFEVEYPQHSFSGDYMYNTDHVDPIANIIGISQTDQRYDIAIVTSEDANSKTKFYVDYLVMWFNEGNMRQITGTILTYSDDADHDGIKNKKDNCKLRAGPIENFGCPYSVRDYGVN